MSPLARLEAALAPDLVAAIVELVDERIGAVAVGEGERDSPWYSVEGAAGYLGVSERTIERAIRGKRLRSTVLGRRRLLHRDDLNAFARSGGRGASANPLHPAASEV